MAAIVLGGSALIGKRFAGNRATLAVIGLLGLAFVLIQRIYISDRVDELDTRLRAVRDLTQLEVTAATPTSSYSVGLWLIALAAVVVAVTAIVLPRQIAPRFANRSELAMRKN